MKVYLEGNLDWELPGATPSFGTTWGKSTQDKVPGYSSQMLYFPDHNGANTCLLDS